MNRERKQDCERNRVGEQVRRTLVVGGVAGSSASRGREERRTGIQRQFSAAPRGENIASAHIPAKVPLNFEQREYLVLYTNDEN